MGHRGRHSNDQVARRAIAWLALGALFVVALPTTAAAQLSRRVYASGFTSPVAFVQDPSDRTVQYVVQQTGQIFALRNGIIQGTPFLDLSGIVTAGGEDGLLGLAFPPDYATTGRFYVNYTNRAHNGFGDTVVARYRRSAGNPLVAGSEHLELLWSTGQRFIVQPFSNHNGGNLAFGPDGYLYMGMGDGGSGDDPGNNAQTPGTLLGKMLRIDVSVPDADTKGFRIPLDNPFPPGNTLGALPEIWDFGVRNPWRWSFDDPARGGTGALVIGDVGQNSFEEVDYEPAGRGGRNYGWSIREGAHAHLTKPTPPQPLVDPIHEYTHAFGVSITGGFVYRGLKLGPAYRGRYFFADFGSGRVWSLGLAIDPSTGEARVANITEHTGELGGVGNVSSFGVDADGELYIVDYSGRILAIQGLQRSVRSDVDGDFRSDLVVWRPADGVWYTAKSSSGYATALATPFGDSAAGDVPLMGDIDGDGQRDFITWRASTGTFGWVTSSTNYSSGGSKQWGNKSLGDIPLIGDIDGDGKSDLIVWRASTGVFFWLPSSTNYDYATAGSKQWGNQGLGDIPLIGDFDADRRSDLAVWRASNGTFYWLFAAGGFDYAAARGLQWGNSSLGDRPMLGDFDGDGRADPVVWRASTGVWFWLTSSTQYAYAGQHQRDWGRASLGDVPLLGDFDGDGRSDIAVWRAQNGTWFWLTSSSGYAGGGTKPWGSSSLGDIPVMK
jgi:glucose/arabinose dehydrogenase